MKNPGRAWRDRGLCVIPRRRRTQYLVMFPVAGFVFRERCPGDKSQGNVGRVRREPPPDTKVAPRPPFLPGATNRKAM